MGSGKRLDETSSAKKKFNLTTLYKYHQKITSVFS